MRNARRRLLPSLVVALVAAIAGTAASASAAAPVYVANSDGGRVDVHDVPADDIRNLVTAYDADDDIAAGDVDGDGTEDLVVANDGDANDDGGRIDIHHGDGSKTSFVVLGFDGDSDEVEVGNVLAGATAEIVVADESHGRLQVFDAGGTRLAQFDTTFDGDDEAALADLTRDGLDDLVVANAGEGGRADVHDLDADGDVVRTFDTGHDSDDQMAAGDVTGDGYDDVVVANTENNRIDVIDAFGGSHDFPSAFDADDELAVGDAIGGIAEEVVVANTEGNRVDVFDGDGDVVEVFDSAYSDGDELAVGAFGGGDLDADGIPDRVELTGIRDEQGDIVAEWNLAERGASPCRKDILVDVDYMHNGATGSAAISHEPRPGTPATAAAPGTPGTIATVQRSFAAAPVEPITNCPYPDVDTRPGINLIVDPIDSDDRVPYDAVMNVPEEFETLKSDHFDAALDPYVHYNVWGSQYREKDKPLTTSGGLANFTDDGQDFINTMGGFASFGSETEQAVGFMHELGHSLGLGHGGDVKVNCKPNYLSIMNYSFTYGGLVDADDPGHQIVDFSRSDDLQTLRESALVEADGLGGGPVLTPDGRTSVLETLWHDGGVVRHGRVGAPAVDFNGDGDEIDTLPMDVNDGPQCASAGAGQTLRPFDDWQRLGAGLFPADSDGADPPDEPTAEHHQQLQAFWDQALVPDRATVVEPPLAGHDRTVLGLAADERFVYATHQYRNASSPSQTVGDGKLVLLDRRTMAVVARITVGQAPRAVAINPLTNRAYVVNGGKDSYSLSVVDLGARKEIAEIALGQNPIDVAVNTKLNRVYVSNPFQSSIQVIDGKTNTKLAPIPIGPGAQGMAVDEARGAIYVAMTNRIPGTPLVIALGVAVDDGVGRPRVLPRTELGEEGVQPQDVAYDPASDRIYVAGLGGGGVAPSVTVLDGRDRQIVERIPMPGPVRAIDVNSAAGLVVAAGDRGVELIDEQTLKSVRHIDAGLAFGVATRTGHARQLFTGDFRSGEVRRLSYSSGEPR